MLLKTFLTFLSLLSLAATNFQTAAGDDPVRTVFQFPVGTFVENIAIRPNGEILITILTSPYLMLLNSTQVGPQPVLVHNFTDYLACAGIVEYEKDVYAVGVGNFSIAKKNFNQSTWSVWSVDLRGVKSQQDGTLSPPPGVSKIADIENITLNGMGLLSWKEKTVLIADFVGGRVLRLDCKTGEHEVVIDDYFVESANGHAPFPPVGVDGVRVNRGSVYVTNYGKKFLARIPIHEDGTPKGNGTIVTPAVWDFDDFTFDRHGNVFIATAAGNSIERISPNGKHQRIIAGNVYSTLITEPTSCAFGRGKEDRHILFVSTGGGLLAPVNESIIVGGQVLAIATHTGQG